MIKLKLRPWVVPGLVRRNMPDIDKVSPADKVSSLVLKIRQHDWEQVREKRKTGKRRLIRTREIVFTRQLMCYMLKRHTTMTLKAIGEYIAPKTPLDHSTVLYNIQTINDLIDTEPELASLVRKLDAVLTDNDEHLSITDLKPSIPNLEKRQDYVETTEGAAEYG